MGAHTTQCLDCAYCFNGCPGANLDSTSICPPGFAHQKRDLGAEIRGTVVTQTAGPPLFAPDPPYETRLRDEVAMRIFVEWDTVDREKNAWDCADAFMAERKRRMG